MHVLSFFELASKLPVFFLLICDPAVPEITHFNRIVKSLLETDKFRSRCHFPQLPAPIYTTAGPNIESGKSNIAVTIPSYLQSTGLIWPNKLIYNPTNNPRQMLRIVLISCLRQKYQRTNSQSIRMQAHHHQSHTDRR